MNKDKIKGGKSDNKSIADIAKHHGLDNTDILKSNLQKGIRVEKEHVDNDDLATEIAKDHLMEFPDYYDRLEKLEKEAEKDWSDELNETIKTKLTNMLLEHDNVSITDETPNTLSYDILYNDRPTGHIIISAVNGSPSDDECSILDFKVFKGEKPLAVITNAIPNLFKLNKTINKIYVPVNPYNRFFWEKAGATRLKKGIHVFNR